MFRIVMSCALLLLATASAQAERICDLEDRFFDSKLKHDEVVTISGKIVESYDRDDDGNYSYDVEDSCGVAYIGSSRPISCKGTVTVTGKFDEDVSDDEMAISIWVSRYTCR